MRIDSVNGYRTNPYAVNSRNRKKNSINSNYSASSPKLSLITFTGGVKNLKQVASFTPENKGLGLQEAYAGGEGVVGYELPESLRAHEKIDARSFMPFWEHNNPKGGYKYVIMRQKDYPADQPLPDFIPAKDFYSADVGETPADVAKNLGVEVSEVRYVIQSKPEGVGPDEKSKYCLLDAPKIEGSITRPSAKVLGDLETIPYALLQISAKNPEYNKLQGQPHYFVYTPDLARASKPYSYDQYGNVPFEAEIINSDEMRALTQIVHKKMNTPEFGYFNPANIIAHDRPSHTYGNHIANMSAAGDTDANGLKIHIVAHNTGRNYQGVTSDPFKMIAVVGDPADMEVLKSLPDFPILQKAKTFGIDNLKVLTPREHQIAWSILVPYLRNFRDGAGTYNILKTGISAAGTNPDNISTGTVSYQFDTEMKSRGTPDAAKFLTDDYAAIQTKSVLNGCTPANLSLGDPKAKFGRGGNGLSKPEALKGYTPFTYVKESELEAFNNYLSKHKDEKEKYLNITTDIHDVVAAKEKNAKWLSGLIEEAGKKGQDELNKLFFNELQLSEGSNVWGYISKINDGDIIVFGYGRPDEQKGYPITTGGYLEFLKDKSIPVEVKKKVKLITGAGPWDKNADDYKALRRDAEEIWNLDGGIYRHNYMNIEGFTPNRLVGCVHYCLFTSRREMCGVTPLESKIAGTPYGATATGGPVDYTNPQNGFLTDEVVEGPPERYGLSYANTEQEIDQARVNRQKPQVANIFKKFIDQYTNDHESYIAMSKKNIEELVDWHNNNEYNRGKSANMRYMEDIFEYNKPVTSRYMGTLNRITGKFGEFRECAEEILGTTAKTRPMKLIYSVIGGVAVITGGYMLYRNTHKSSEKKLDKTI